MLLIFYVLNILRKDTKKCLIFSEMLLPFFIKKQKICCRLFMALFVVNVEAY